MSQAIALIARRALEGQGEGQQEFGVAPAPAIAAHGDGGLAPGDQDAGLRERLVHAAHLVGDAGEGRGHVARLAFDVGAHDVRGHALGAGFGRRRFKRVLRRGDHVDGAGRDVRRRVGEHRRADMVGHVDAPPRQNGERVARVGFRPDGRAGADHSGIVAGHVRDQPADAAGGGGGRRQTPALDRREGLAHDVHLADRRARAQERLGDRALVVQRDAIERQGQERRCAAGAEEDDEVVPGRRAGEIEDAARGRGAFRVRHWVSGLDHLDVPGRTGMGVAGDDETFDRAAPGAFEFGGHARGGLAGAKDDGAALWASRADR